MALQITNNRDMTGYPIPVPNFQIATSSTPNNHVCYVDKTDKNIGSLVTSGGGVRGGRWDPNLIDSTSSTVGWHDSPLAAGNASSAV